MKRGFSLLLALVEISGLGACSEPEKVANAPEAAAAPAPTPAPAEPSFRGVIRGVVKLADGAELPLGPDPKLSPLSTQPTPPCSPFSDADRRIVLAAEGTSGLWPVHVAVTGMQHIPTGMPRTHVVKALDCRLEPTLIGARVGDTVRFENASAAVLATSFPGESYINTLPVGGSHDVKITGTGVFTTGCPIGAYCGSTRIISVAHPLWAISDTQGSFRIEQVPLGEEVVVHAWHPLFGETNATVTLDASAPEREVTLTLTPVLQPDPKPEKAAKPERAATPAKAAKPKKSADQATNAEAAAAQPVSPL